MTQHSKGIVIAIAVFFLLLVLAPMIKGPDQPEPSEAATAPSAAAVAQPDPAEMRRRDALFSLLRAEPDVTNVSLVSSDIDDDWQVTVDPRGRRHFQDIALAMCRQINAARLNVHHTQVKIHRSDWPAGPMASSPVAAATCREMSVIGM